MRNASEFRAVAREALRGKWGRAVLAALLAMLLGGLTTTVQVDPSMWEESFDQDIALQEQFRVEDLPTTFWVIVIGALIVGLVIAFAVATAFLLLGSVVEVGYAWFNLELVDKKEGAISSLFSYFSIWKTALCSRLLRFLYVFLWTLLFIIPGIIAGYSYAMTAFILADNPDLTAREAITKSKEMMKGNRWRLFCLQFSFIGWELLCILTLGIGSLWVIPYQQAAIAAFYREISGTEQLPVDNELLMEDTGWPGLSD